MEEKDIELLTSPMAVEVEEAVDYSWLVVQDEDSFAMAGTLKKAVDEEIKKIKEYFGPRKSVAQSAHKLWVSAEKESLAPHEKAKSTIVGKQNAYLRYKEQLRKDAEEKIKESGGTFIPPAPKEKGVRTTYKGAVVNPAEFIEWVVSNNLIDEYLTIKTAPLNALAKTGQKVPGFKSVKNVSAI